MVSGAIIAGGKAARKARSRAGGAGVACRLAARLGKTLVELLQR